mgnify:CR=1 FL=1
MFFSHLGIALWNQSTTKESRSRWSLKSKKTRPRGSNWRLFWRSSRRSSRRRRRNFRDLINQQQMQLVRKLFSKAIRWRVRHQHQKWKTVRCGGQGWNSLLTRSNLKHQVITSYWVCLKDWSFQSVWGHQRPRLRCWSRLQRKIRIAITARRLTQGSMFVQRQRESLVVLNVIRQPW